MDNTIIQTLRAIDPTITFGTALATITGGVRGYGDGITVRRPGGPYEHSYREYQVTLAPAVRVQYIDEPRRPTLAVVPVDAVLAVEDTTPPFFFPSHDGRNDRMWE